MAQALIKKTGSKAKAAAQKKPALDIREERAERIALLDRLRATATEADAAKTVDTTGMSDEQFIALLRR